MPRYIVLTGACSGSTLDIARRTLSTRFPELSVESIQPVGELRWSVRCDAPSDEHPRRWLSAAGIAVHSVTPNPANQPENPR